MSKEIITDHLGNEYKTKSEMAEAYGLDLKLLYYRIKSGWSLEKALTTPKVDIFVAASKEATKCGISASTYRNRIARGWDSEKAASTIPTVNSHAGNPVATKDHTGREFSSVGEMCAFYGVSPETYKKRRQRGFTLEEALTIKPIRGQQRQKDLLEDR